MVWQALSSPSHVLSGMVQDRLGNGRPGPALCGVRGDTHLLLVCRCRKEVGCDQINQGLVHHRSLSPPFLRILPLSLSLLGHEVLGEGEMSLP